MRCRLVNRNIRNNYTIELLKERGLTDKEIDYFLNVPDDSYLQSPENLNNMNKAAGLFNEITKMSSKERIVVVVDSDVDGFTSAAIFIQYLRNFNPEIQITPILHEGKGHGLSDTISVILEEYNNNPNIKAVILPDAGSNDYEYHEQLGNFGIWSLMFDHHIVELDTQFSDWAIIVNNQLSESYLNKNHWI